MCDKSFFGRRARSSSEAVAAAPAVSIQPLREVANVPLLALASSASCAEARPLKRLKTTQYPPQVGKSLPRSENQGFFQNLLNFFGNPRMRNPLAHQRSDRVLSPLSHYLKKRRI